MSFDKMATKRKQMSTPVKDAIISMSSSGYSQREIADILKVSQSGVSKFLKLLIRADPVKTVLEAVELRKLMLMEIVKF
jgi:predicted transcriptional regulator